MRAPLLAVTVACSATILCDGAAQAGPDAAPFLEEVVVTARKFAEPRLQVPLSIDVVDPESLDPASSSTLAALSAQSPGLYFESLWGGLGAAPVLRGQAQPSTAGDNVGVFVDGVYQAERTTIDVSPLDIARIEVVRGPQSTLFGHSTFAGALHYVPRAATRDFEAGASLGLGSDDFYSASGFLSGPLIADALLARLAAGVRDSSGTYHNAVDGNALGGLQRTDLAMSVETAPAGDLSVRLSARGSHARTRHPAVSTVGGSQYDCGALDPVSGAWSYYCGALPLERTFDISSDVPDSTQDLMQAKLAMAWQLGAVDLASDTSYYRGSSDAYRDFDASSAGETFGVCELPECPRIPEQLIPVRRLLAVNSVQRQSPRTEEWTQEFRVRVGNADAPNWMLGVAGFVAHEDSLGYLGFARGDLGDSERLTVLLPLTPDIAGPVARANAALVDDPARQQVLQTSATTSRRTLAVFGTVEYPWTSQLRGRLEVRTTWERIALDSRTANFAPSFGDAIPPEHFTDTTPRLSLEFSPSARGQLYLSAAKGSRSGGINPVPGLPSDEQTFEPEYNWTYEFGSRYAGDRVRMAATLYYIDWRNTQLLGLSSSPLVSTLITRNAAGVTTPGFEMSIDAALARRMKVHAAYSYADTRFKPGSDDPGSSAFCGLKGTQRTSSFCTVGPPRDRSEGSGSQIVVPYVDGNALQRAPAQQYHVGLEAELAPSGAPWHLTSTIDVGAQDDVYDRPINGARYGARTLTSARMAFARGRWTAEFWGSNLGDQRYVRAVSSRGAAFYPVSPRPLDLVYGDGRRFGITFRYAR